MIKKLIIICFIVVATATLVFFATRRINLVIIGTDNVEKNSCRADTIIFVSYKPFTKKLSILSIPRDTVVELPYPAISGKRERIKINAVYMYGYSKAGEKKGSKLVMDTVSDLLNTRIPFYIHIDYEAFVKTIDLLGGVKVKVANRMKYRDIAGKLDIDIAPGIHNFNGKKALEFIRYRSHELADIGRIARQQEFIKALIKKITKEYNIKNIVEITKIMFKYVDTNLIINDTIVFINKVRTIESIKIDILPGEPIYVKGVSYWYPDYQKVQQLVKELLN